MRMTKWVKFWLHVQYLIFFFLLVAHRTFRVVIFERLERHEFDLKHILIWTELPGVKLEGQQHLANKHCEFMNCFFTKNRTLFGDLRYFDAIVFDVHNVSGGAVDMPKVRSSMQKYIFVSNVSADNYPVCDPGYDDFFNWTWTYRSDSIIRYNFIALYNLEGQYLGNHVNWPKLRPIDRLERNHLATKTVAAAVFLDECKSRSKRETFIADLQKELAKYNQTVDVFGNCGKRKCRKRVSYSNCYYRLRKDYYFFLALEDSIAPDYVTDVVLHAYKNDVVPVVYGGAKYKNFLPPNSFIDSKLYTIPDLAKKMVAVMENKKAYYEYFSWKNHCSIDKAPVLDLCTLCESLNTRAMVQGSHTYTHFRKWWNYQFEFVCQNQNSH